MWDIHIMDGYGLELETPDGWNANVNEGAQNPEPGHTLLPRTDQECVTFTFTNPEETLVLTLHPTCGFMEAASSSCSQNGVIVKQWGGQYFILRWFDEQSLTYRYSEANMNTVSDRLGTHKEMQCANPPVLAFDGGKGLTFIEIELQYLGADSEREAALQQADHIVASIRKH